MNKAILRGNLTKDPDVRYTGADNNMAVASFTVAVQRRVKNAEGKYDADFIRCTAFGKTAEFVDKWFKKGSAIIVEGRITTGSYQHKDGYMVYTTEVTVENVEFGGGKAENSATGSVNTQNRNMDFMNVPDTSAEELPF